MLARLHDPILVLVSLTGVVLLLKAVRWVHHVSGISPFVVRKVLHALIGAWTMLLTVLFVHRGWALVPPVIFTGLNVSPRLRAHLPQLAEDARTARGLWMFPLAVVLLYAFFWNGGDRGAVLAGCAALGLADPAAALVGSKLGQRRYGRWGHGRSVEGSLAFLAVAGIACGWIAASSPAASHALRVAVGCGVVGAVAEVVSPHGFDNLSVPLLVAAAYRILA